MTSHYHDPDDLKRFKDMRQLAPAEFEAWVNLDRIVGREDGKIPRKYRELIALAVAHTTQCVYCIDAHVKGAKKAGASREEIRSEEHTSELQSRLHLVCRLLLEKKNTKNPIVPNVQTTKPYSETQ